ncbi:hypothetical protein E3T26_06860 [Cryobacterium sp. TMT1-21]|uniref:hypothetical protein n=1 Tax=Cryobacterium sp. TMT1-21 TaxID=1259234 RepID=UPI00106C3CA5|nr:hypothetical protein [Cryobacterium sp. TMT1-21]TFD15496.1 hypothetical protein E3T26_06860 [Cryobacterium sp. TMT1-21]
MNTPHAPTDDGELHELARTYRRELADIGIKFTGYSPKSEGIRLVNIAIDEADAKHELAIHQYGNTRAVEAEILQAKAIKTAYEIYSHESTPFYKVLCEAINSKELKALTQPPREANTKMVHLTYEEQKILHDNLMELL